MIDILRLPLGADHTIVADPDVFIDDRILDSRVLADPDPWTPRRFVRFYLVLRFIEIAPHHHRTLQQRIFPNNRPEPDHRLLDRAII